MTAPDGKSSPHTEIPYTVYRSAAIRVGDWKLIVPGKISRRTKPLVDFRPEGVELFNLAMDPYETINLADERGEKVEELLERIVFYAKQTAPVQPGTGLYGGFPPASIFPFFWTVTSVNTHDLIVKSNPPGGLISLSSADVDGNWSSTTPFVRQYKRGALIALTAPNRLRLESGMYLFEQWKLGDREVQKGATTSLIINRTTTAIAQYQRIVGFPDVNSDGIVDIFDLVEITAVLSAGCSNPIQWTLRTANSCGN